MSLIFKLIKTTLSVVFIAWFVGFIWYAEFINHPPQDLTTQTDAIVVLTGGSNRVEAGFELLKEKLAKKLFVSGVYKRVSLEGLKRKYNIKDTPACCVELGYQARNTVGNAEETSQWMQKNNFTTLRVVTANYHMPRSLIEFKRHMPDIRIISHPIKSDRVKQDSWWYWPGTLSLMVREYSKFIYVYVKDVKTKT